MIHLNIVNYNQHFRESVTCQLKFTGDYSARYSHFRFVVTYMGQLIFEVISSVDCLNFPLA